jgi:hypothetical protein
MKVNWPILEVGFNRLLRFFTVFSKREPRDSLLKLIRIYGHTFPHSFLPKYYVLEEMACKESKLAHFGSGFSTIWRDTSLFAQNVSRNIIS